MTTQTLPMRERLAAALAFFREIGPTDLPGETWTPTQFWAEHMDDAAKADALAEIDVVLAELRVPDRHMMSVFHYLESWQRPPPDRAFTAMIDKVREVE